MRKKEKGGGAIGSTRGCGNTVIIYVRNGRRDVRGE